MSKAKKVGSIPKRWNVRLSASVAIPVVLVALATASFVESAALKKLDYPKPKKTSCIQCHTDKKTLAAIAEKSGDKLYLVHSGDLTLSQLKRLQGQKATRDEWK